MREERSPSLSPDAILNTQKDACTPQLNWVTTGHNTQTEEDLTGDKGREKRKGRRVKGDKMGVRETN